MLKVVDGIALRALSRPNGSLWRVRGGRGIFEGWRRGGMGFLKFTGGVQRIFEARNDNPGPTFFKFNCLVP